MFEVSPLWLPAMGVAVAYVSFFLVWGQRSYKQQLEVMRQEVQRRVIKQIDETWKQNLGLINEGKADAHLLQLLRKTLRPYIYANDATKIFSDMLQSSGAFIALVGAWIVFQSASFSSIIGVFALIFALGVFLNFNKMINSHNAIKDYLENGVFNYEN